MWRLKTKIVSGEYVNFSDLLDPSKADQCKLAVKKDEDGATLVVKNPGTAHYKQSVKSIQDWDSAFAIYSTVYCSAHHDQFPQLLKYSETVKRIARQGADWGHYNVSFRCQRQAMPSLPWDYFHSEPYNVAMCQRSKLGQSQALGAGSFRKLFIPNDYCWQYHSTGQCSFGGACKYSHSCIRCQGNHAATKCNTKSRPRKSPGGSGGNHQTTVGTMPNPTRLPTPVQPDKPASLLIGYNQFITDYLLTGFLEGFKVGFSGESMAQCPRNLLRAIQLPHLVSVKLQKEMDLGRISGPWPSPPFPNLVISPVGPHCKPITSIGEPFSRVVIDSVGPLPKTKAGNKYLITIMCTSTRFPEALPLQKITAPVIVDVLRKLFTMFGMPKEIQNRSRTKLHPMQQLQIKHVTLSAYHPQSQRALDRYHRTLKTMMKR